MLVDFLVFKLRWEPSYVRKMMLPMLSTLYLRERSASPSKTLLYDQYELHSIQCIKTRYGHQLYVVKWRKYVFMPSIIISDEHLEETTVLQDRVIDNEEHVDPLDGLNEPQVHNDGGDCFLLTVEFIGLVRSAFPGVAGRLMREKELRESERKHVLSLKSESESPRSMGVQQSITDFCCSKKVQTDTNPGEGSKHSAEMIPNGKRSQSSSNISNCWRHCLFEGVNSLKVMNCEEGLSGESPKNKGRSPEDICVLLLDSDPTCLAIISKMLQKSGYRVVTAERGADALHILRDKDGEIDLIMTEAHLSDMDKYELLETITGISKLPIVVMTVDGQANSALSCLCKGAKHYLLKPFVMGDLKHLWQATISSRRGMLSQLDSGRPKQNGPGNNAQSPLHVEECTGDNKRRELAETEEHKEDNDNCELGNQKKPKLICADELHNGPMQGFHGVGPEDELSQGKNRKERAEAEKPKAGDNYELRNEKILAFSCMYEAHNESSEAIQGLGTDENNKKKEQVETDIYQEDGDNPELGIQKQPEQFCATENVGDLGPDEAYLDENLQNVNVTGLTEANVLLHIQDQGMLAKSMCQTVSNGHGVVPRSVETTVQSFGATDPLSPVESSSNDHMWTQMRKPMPRRGANPVENPQLNVEDNPDLEELVNGEIDFSGISELVFGNIQELEELLNDDPVQEHEQQPQQQQEEFLEEEQGSSSDVLEKSPEDLLDETFSDLW